MVYNIGSCWCWSKQRGGTMHYAESELKHGASKHFHHRYRLARRQGNVSFHHCYRFNMRTRQCVTGRTALLYKPWTTFNSKDASLPHSSFRALVLAGFAGLMILPRRTNRIGIPVAIKYTLLYALSVSLRVNTCDQSRKQDH